MATQVGTDMSEEAGKIRGVVPRADHTGNTAWRRPASYGRELNKRRSFPKTCAFRSSRVDTPLNF